MDRDSTKSRALRGRDAVASNALTSVDGGRELEDGRTSCQKRPVLPICHTRFRLPWQWNGKEAILQSRCVDDTGYVQPTLGQLIAVRGLNGPLGSIYRLNAIQSWHVARKPTERCPKCTPLSNSQQAFFGSAVVVDCIGGGPGTSCVWIWRGRPALRVGYVFFACRTAAGSRRVQATVATQGKAGISDSGSPVMARTSKAASVID